MCVFDRQGKTELMEDIRRVMPHIKDSDMEELAEQVGVTPAFIGHLEAPNILKALSLDTLFDIAAVLDVPPYKFLCFDDF